MCWNWRRTTTVLLALPFHLFLLGQRLLIVIRAERVFSHRWTWVGSQLTLGLAYESLEVQAACCHFLGHTVGGWTRGCFQRDRHRHRHWDRRWGHGWEYTRVLTTGSRTLDRTERVTDIANGVHVDGVGASGADACHLARVRYAHTHTHRHPPKRKKERVRERTLSYTQKFSHSLSVAIFFRLLFNLLFFFCVVTYLGTCWYCSWGGLLFAGREKGLLPG